MIWRKKTQRGFEGSRKGQENKQKVKRVKMGEGSWKGQENKQKAKRVKLGVAERGKAFEKDRPTNKNNKQHMQHMSGKRRQGKGGDACPLKWNASGLFGPLLDPTATSYYYV